MRTIGAARDLWGGMIAFWLLGACGGSLLSPPGTDTFATPDATMDWEGGAADGDGGPWLEDAGDGQVAPDMEPGELPPLPDAWPEPEPGETGYACEDGDDCNSGYCVLAREGSVCSKPCSDRCIRGWSCQQDVAVLPQIANICQPDFPTLCFPCRTNADCLAPTSSKPHRCIPAGDAGAFCGGACSDSRPCPEGFFCTTVADVAGGTAKQCLPELGECGCSLGAVEVAASTVCSLTTPDGACKGERYCTEEAELTACDAEMPEPEVCDGRDNDCDGTTDEGLQGAACLVENELGACPGVLACGGEEGGCQGPTPAAESCNGGKDDDCDGKTDEEDAEGCQLFHLDEDGDGFGVDATRCLCAPQGLWDATKAGDCDDETGKVRPDAVEVCNSVDDDCDGETDPPDSGGCASFHADRDGDGFGDPDDALCLCFPEAPYVTTDAGDCDDSDAARNGAASELCNDGVDDDCDGLTDEAGAAGCTLLFADADGDGFGDQADFSCLCEAGGVYVTAQGGDCDDGTAESQPGLAESCDGRDNDCDGLTDEAGALGCLTRFRDDDGDGFGTSGDYRCACAGGAPYTAEAGGDCDDSDADIAPGAEEVCNGVDDDCDDVVDGEGIEGCFPWYRDADADGYGSEGDIRCLCEPASPYVAPVAGDCDDANPMVSPDAGEVCNALDDDCDGLTDVGVGAACTEFFADADGDGWGAGEGRCLCEPEGTFVTPKGGDCDDGESAIFPFADEICNDADDDCDGLTDEDGSLGCQLWFRDGDGDGFGLLNDAQCLCAADGEYTSQSPGDCDDGVAAAFPGSPEVCNGADDDCDGATDEPGAEGCEAKLRDTDGDGYGVTGDSLCVCAQSETYLATVGGDCDDGQAGVNPGMDEVCNGLDDDCNGVADDPGIEGCEAYYRDRDGDGWGVEGESMCLCGPLSTFSAQQYGDCDDLAGSVNPDALERCNGGVDDDCDGNADPIGTEGCVTYYLDADSDGWGVDTAATSACLCQAMGAWSATKGGDCDDGAAGVFPNQLETCNGGVDDDCDGATDEEGADGCTLYYRDADRDGAGDGGSVHCLCAAEAPWDAIVAGDCDDDDATLVPGATEVCNGIDDNCDGATDEPGADGCTVYYADGDGDGYGDADASLCLCARLGAYTATEVGDCNDGAPLIHPGQPEICNGGTDDNCNGTGDEAGATGCVVLLRDTDGDGFGVAGTETCICGPTGEIRASVGGDCDDGASAVNPDASETCNAIDDQCDGRVDEGCGLPVQGWPTHMYDARRTGHTMQVEGPDSPGLRWKTDLPVGGAAMLNSPVIFPGGDIVVSVADKVFRLNQSNGSYAAWTPYTLPAPIYPRSGPTLRVGGTIVVPAGRYLVMLGPDLSEIWVTDLGSVLVSTPIVDPNGNIYVVSATALHKVGVDGVQQWSVPVDNDDDTPSHPAIGINGRIYFAASDHHVYAVDPEAPAGSRLVWAVVPNGVPGSELGQPVDASVTISELGYIYVPFGPTIYGLNIAGGTLYTTTLGNRINAGLGIHNTGYVCCNPEEYIWANRAGSNDLRVFRLDLAYRDDTSSFLKDQPRSANPVFDRDGDVFIGSDAGRFYAFTQGTGHKWTWGGGGLPRIDGTAAVGEGYIVFGDAAGSVRCVN